MTKKPEILLEQISAGVHAGAVAAIERARQTGSKLVVWLDGKIAEITPDEAERMLKQKLSAKEKKE